jgi:hypothetical protein
MKSANRKYWNLISSAKAQMSNEIPMSKKEVNGDQ